jgi:hypothetical protein
MNFNAKIIDDFLSEKECQDIVSFVKTIEPWEQDDPGVEIWNNRILTDYTVLTVHSEEVGKKLYEIKNRIATKIKELYEVEEIYADLLSVSRWFPGMDQSPHADDMSNVPEEKNEWFNHRDFGSVIYLNTDYSGGNTYYPDHGIEVVPKVGTLVLHPASPDHLHGVTKIEDGMRYTISSFWTSDKTYDQDSINNI